MFSNLFNFQNKQKTEDKAKLGGLAEAVKGKKNKKKQQNAQQQQQQVSL